MNPRALFFWFPVALAAVALLVGGVLRLGAPHLHADVRFVQSTPAPAKQSSELMMDVDGDGIPERVQLEKVDDAAWANVYAREQGRWTLRSTTRLGEWRDDAGADALAAVDVNGDGKMDLMRRWNRGGVAWAQVFLSSGAAFEPGWQGPVDSARCSYAC